MTFTGHVEDGKIVFPLPIPVPDGTRVKVEAEGTSAVSSSPETAKRTMLLDHYRDVVGTVELPTDAASQHDHYLYGSPKR